MKSGEGVVGLRIDDGGPCIVDFKQDSVMNDGDVGKMR